MDTSELAAVPETRADPELDDVLALGAPPPRSFPAGHAGRASRRSPVLFVWVLIDHPSEPGERPRTVRPR